jgi:SPP1 gp7 family putative phage head morphogenesis protein
MAEPFTPIAAARFMDERMFWVSGVLRDDLTRKAQGLLTRAIQFGEPLDDVVGKLADLFAPYILEGVTPEVVTPFRLETIVRTNMTEAYNMGRLADVHDPDMALYIEGVRYSAILDTRTTPICAFLHDKVFKPDDPELDRLAPANHFNCRSILVPVIVGEEVDDGQWITEAEKQEALDMIKVGFGGNDPEYAERAALPRFYKENDDAQSHAD